MDYSAWAIAQLRAGRPLEELNAVRITPPWSEYVGICRTINGGDRRAAFDAWIGSHPQGRELVAQVFQVPIHLTEYPEPSDLLPVANRVEADVPELPVEARLSPEMERAAADTGSFIADCAEHVARFVPTMPRYMLTNAALTTVSIAVARRLVLPMYYGDVFPILWTLIVAASTVFGKTTALNFYSDLADDAMPHLLLPTESSNDRLIQNMAGIKPVNFEQLPLFKQDRLRHSWKFAGQRGVIVDEASSVFGSFDKEYNRGKIETFLRAYDCARNREHETNKYGLIWLRHLYMPFLGATTPESAQFANTEYMWGSGFWPRFNLLVPEKQFPDEEDDAVERIERPAELTHTLVRLLNRLPEPSVDEPDPHAPPENPNQITVLMDGEVMAHWKHYQRTLRRTFQNPDVVPNLRLRPMLGRMPHKLLCAAILLAALDWREGEAAPRIRLPHYARAHQLAEEWRVNAYRFVEVMNARPDAAIYERRLLECIRRLELDKKPATIRELQKLTHWDREVVVRYLELMRDDGLLESIQSDGKRTLVWRILEGGNS